MIKQNVFIVNLNSLYEILEEIKENFSFKIIGCENIEDLNTTEYPDIKKSLIILQSEQKLILNDNLKNENFFRPKNFPMSLNKLVELINVNLIKLRFNYQSKIEIKGYQLNFNSKFFIKNNLSLKLTEKEIEIILYLNQTKMAHDVENLQKNIWGYSMDMETHTVETHIYRLRKKIFKIFGDENFIITKKNGYQIK